MATYSQVKVGAKGAAVSELQKLLNQNGYSLATDGVFGANTQAAVSDYQKKNGLTVDGIAGNQTWSSLFGSSGSSNSNTTVNYLTDYGSKPSYQQSSAVLNAANMLSQYEGNRPGVYQSNYADQIQGVLNGIMNREKFNYDFASDPMYQQYSDKYQQQGKLAMMDTMGNAAALSGGYGNSYAQSVGQQAYQGYLQKVNDIIPELRNAAYQTYRDEGQDMYNKMGMLQGLDNTDYGRYRDTVGDWQTDRNYYAGRYDSLYGQDYGAYRDNVSDWQSDRSFNYGASQDALAQSNWEKEYQLAVQKAAASGKSGGSSSGKSSSSSSKSVDGKTMDELENIALMMWNSSGMGDPREKVNASNSYTTAQKKQLIAFLNQLNDYTRGK